MSLCSSSVRCQVEKQHEIAAYIRVVSYLESRIRVVNTRPFEERSLHHDRRLLVTHV